MATVRSYKNRDDMLMSMTMEAADMCATFSPNVRSSFMALARKVIAKQMELIDNADRKKQ